MPAPASATLALATPVVAGSAAEAAPAKANPAAPHPILEVPPLLPSADGPDAPRRLVRLLVALQDDMARGSAQALAAQRIVMLRIQERFGQLPPDIWSTPHEARALALYALSGGDPAVVRQALDGATPPPPYDRLLAGALAYLEGRSEDAERHFEAVPPMPLEAGLAGPVHLARAALTVASDPRLAERHLAAARHAAPGTLVEEAALRRAILLAAEADDTDEMTRLVGRYLRRFKASVYAGNFRRRLAAALTRMRFIQDPGAFDRLDAVLEPLTVEGRQEIYLLVARAALENGERRSAELAAARVEATADPASLDALRAQLYGAAARVVDPAASGTAVAALAALDRAAVPEEDRPLLDAALRLSASIALPEPSAEARPMDIATPPAPPPAGEATLQTPPADDAAVTAVEARVTSALADIDSLLERLP